MAVTMSASLKQNSQNIEKNTSSVTLTVKVTTTYGSYNHNGASGTVKFTGNYTGTFNFTATFDLTSTTTIYTKTFTVNHSADGTAKVTAAITFDTDISSGVLTKTVSKTLTTIPRASTPSVSGTTQLGSPITINTNRKSSSFTHTITWKWAGRTGTIATKTDDASVAWTPAIATFAPYLTDATADECVITCTTYSGSTAIGSKTCKFDLSIPASVVPSVSDAAVSDAVGLLAEYGAFVQNMSGVAVTVTAAGIYGSTIKSYRASMDGLTASGTSNALSIGAPPNTGTRTVTVTVTDTRGRSASKNVTISVVSYSAPILNASAYRVDASTGKEDDESTTIRVAASGSVHNVNNKGTNTGTVKIEWKLSTAETWTVASNAARGQAFSFSLDIAGKANTNRFDIRVTVTDSLGSAAQIELSVGTARPVMDFRNGGDGVAVLGIADRAGFRVGASSSFGGALGFEDEDGVTHDFMTPQANGRPTVANHMALANGIYLQALLASGAATNILRMNESGQLELNWTSGGMRGRVWKQLWSGTAASGSTISVPEHHYYNVFAISVGSADSTIIAPRDLDNTNVIRGMSPNPYVSAERTAIQIFACDIDVSGNNFILTRVWMHQLYMSGTTVTTSSANNKAMSITRIYGLL